MFYSSGIRVTEAYSLNISDVDLDNREFVVFGKGDKARVGIMSKEAKLFLQEYLNTRHDKLPALFISRLGNRMSVRAMQDFIKDVGHKVLDKRIHPHLFRHGTAMLLLEKGLRLDEIQKVLGHENIGTTQIYARTSMSKVKKDVDVIFDNIGLTEKSLKLNS